MVGYRNFSLGIFKTARQIGSVALFGCTMLVLGVAGGAQAAPCDDLGGTIVGAECQINGPVTASGNFLLPQTLHLLAGGVITVSPEPVGLEIGIAGDFIMDIGSKIDGDVTGNGFIGAAITINATGNVILRGNGATGAIITAEHKGGCSDPGKGGSVTLNANTDGGLPPDPGDLTTEPGSEISVDATGCPAGEIILTGVNINTDGNVHSESELSGGSVATQRPGGGPITIKATCDLTVSDTGIVSSKGRDPGADLVHLEGGCDVLIFGLVQSTGPGHVIPVNPPNHCHDDAGSAGGMRPDKPDNSTACVEIWAGENIEINSVAPHTGQVNADTAQSGGFQRSWIDVFAGRGNLTIVGDSAAPYAIHANVFRTNAIGGIIQTKSRDGEVSADGLAIQANACRLNPADCSSPIPGGRGGEIIVEAGGVPPSGDVNFHAASIQAKGATEGSGVQAGGKISARSSNSQVVGVAPGELNASGGGALGTVTLQGCNPPPGVNYTGTATPLAVVLPLSCGVPPTFESYVIFKDCPCGGPGPGCIEVTKECTDAVALGQPIHFNGVVSNCGGDPLTNVTVTDDNGTPADPLDDVVVLGPINLAPQGQPGDSAPYAGNYVPTTNPSTDTVTAEGTPPVGPPVTATASATCQVVECPEDPKRQIDLTVNLAVPAGGNNYHTVQAAVNAAGPGDVIGLYSSTTENVVISGATSLTITQCTVAKINAADNSLPVVTISSPVPILIIGPDTFGGTVGWNIVSNGHELRGVRASFANDAGIGVFGNQNKVSWNSVRDGSDVGVLVEGDSNGLRGGVIENNGGNGVEFTATANGNSLNGATVRNNGGDGVLVDGTGNKLKQIKASNNVGNEFDVGPGNVNQGSNKANGVACNFGAAGGVCN